MAMPSCSGYTLKRIKIKKANWSDKETSVLLDEVKLQYTLLVSKLQNTVTLTKKRQIWQSIVDRVNSVGGNGRDLEACKKRWKDLRSAFLNKKTEAARTGGGKPPSPVPFEDEIGIILGAGSCLTSGINGGIDTDADLPQEPSVQVLGSAGIDTDFDHSQELSVQVLGSGSLSADHEHYTPWKEYEIHNYAIPMGESSQYSIDLNNPDNINDVMPASYTNSSSQPRSVSPTVREMPSKVKKRKMLDTTMEMETELKQEWLRSEIEKNKIITEVAELKKRKLKLEIELLEQSKLREGGNQH